jgi:hypothetical protein
MEVMIHGPVECSQIGEVACTEGATPHTHAHPLHHTTLPTLHHTDTENERRTLSILFQSNHPAPVS